MNKSERLELQRQLTNAEAKFLKYRGSGVIPTPKALRYRRTADELRRQIARILIQGVNFLYTWSDEEIKGVAHNSMRFADALIAECQLTDKLKGE